MTPSPQRISFFKPRPENRCVYCNSTSYGCHLNPLRIHDPFGPKARFFFLNPPHFVFAIDFMKTLHHVVLAAVIAGVFTATASAQSWGFTLPGGAGFAYSSGGGGVSVSGGGYGYGGSVWAGGPTVYYPSACGYRGPVYIPQGAPGVFGGYGPVPNAGYIRRGPISNFTSYWVVYPNVW